MRSSSRFVALLRLLFIGVFFAPVPAFAAGPETPPVETLSATDARLVLNGVWRFQPAAGPAATAPTTSAGSWGEIRVPGHWDTESWDARWLEGVVTPGTEGGWAAVKVETVSVSRPTKIIKKLESAWYERAFTVPAAWRGRQVVLRLETPCTDVHAWLDGRQAGAASWPIGEIDLTPLLRFDGRPSALRILVTATPEARGIGEAMDHDRITVTRGVLDHRGLAGDVFLLARPAARVDGVFIQPSLRQKHLGLDVDFTGLAEGRRIDLSIIALRGDSPAARWTETVTVPAAGPDGRATVRGLRLPWSDPVLWDLDQPELHTLSVRATAPGLDSEHRERFGFREFWIEGRHFYLNGSVFNFRPDLLGSQHVDPRLMRLALEGLRSKNFNIAEYWPGPDSARGSKNLVLRHHWARVGDELGFPLILPLLSPDAWFDPLDPTPKPASFAAWQRQAAELWRLTRNSPSVLVHNCVGNRFSHGDDQNPRRIGQRAALAAVPGRAEGASASGARLMAALRAIDATRPVMSHHAADVGDIHTSNNYLNVIPLQERQDWLSEWARVGDMPFMAVEFGAPFSGTYNRGRANHTGQDISEPWLTEFIATYRGADAYLEEDAPYRRMIAQEHEHAMAYKSARVTRSSRLAPFQAFWLRETWPAWRTWGVSGGMIPWEGANGFTGPPITVRHDLPPPPSGALGGYRGEIPENQLGLAAPSLKVNVSGEALIEANAPLRVWIAGPRDDFTRKDHRFVPGETVVKSAVILNDTRAALAWTVAWRATLGDAEIASGTVEGRSEPGVPAFAPITFKAPPAFTPGEGLLRVTANLGGIEKTDTFAFRVAPAPAPPAAQTPLFAFDPDGASSSFLRSAGHAPAVLAPGSLPPAGASLVLGRNALRDPSFTPEWADALTAWVRAGGRLLLLGQDPDWLRERSAFRFARHVSRRAFPVATQREHPLLAGLDAEDFRDWRGDGALLAPEYQTALDRPETRLASFRPPTYGWRWGTRGSVASASLEKPHLSGWTPLLENEFDLAFTPLAELVLGRGYVLWCGLDLEARGTDEPVARELAARLVTRLAAVRPAPRREVVYLGDEAGAARLAALELPFTRVTSAPAGPAADKLLVAGAGAVFDLKGWLVRGGNAFFLPRPEGAIFPGGLRVSRARWSLARSLPNWPEARGLGLGDLRLRVDQPALVFSPAANVAADGALARVTGGEGVAILFQLDPAALPVAEKTYLRFSQWRLNRATAQLLANLGAGFPRDAELLSFSLPRGQPVPLAGEWRHRVEGELIPGAKSADAPVETPANRGLNQNWHRETFDDVAWAPLTLPAYLPELEKKDGVVWFRRDFTLPAEFEGRPLNLVLGPLDDFEDVYVNGVRVGGTPKGTPSNWSLHRVFKLRPGTANAGRNVIAIRLWDHFGGGGFGANATNPMRVELATPLPRPTPYTPGYRDDYAQGDDYARYYRW